LKSGGLWPAKEFRSKTIKKNHHKNPPEFQGNLPIPSFGYISPRFSSENLLKSSKKL